MDYQVQQATGAGRTRPGQQLRPGMDRYVLRGVVAGLLLLLAGCAAPGNRAVSNRPFLFGRDTFAYANELVWEYRFDPVTGRTSHARVEPAPTYTHHCFAMVRSARQFYQHARFDPALPEVDDRAYRRLIRTVVSASPRQSRPAGEEIVIPAYTNLHHFSLAKPDLLREECGSVWQSYCQRGNWRMLFPFFRKHQRRMAGQLTEALDRNLPPVVHIVRFPDLSINHALLLFGYRAGRDGCVFLAYDPNSPGEPLELAYDDRKKEFSLPPTRFFAGGQVDVYQVYHAWNY